MRAVVKALYSALWLCACSAEEPASPPTPAAGSGANASAAMSCSTGPQVCYCPDGNPSGTQVCDAQQHLGACQCNVVSAGPQQGVKADPARLCPQLAGIGSCDARSYASPQLPASVLFVIDRSGSMSCNAPPVQSVESCNADPKRLDAAQPSRWEITTGALDATFSGLMGSSAAVGLTMFSTDGYCGVDSTPIVGVDNVSATQLSALSSAMHKAQPAGGTPIVGAVISAYRHLHEELHAAGNRYVVLITDGEESCGTTGNASDLADLQAARSRLIDVEVKKARDANIKTFVVGTPGSEGARAFLSELAFRGGTARTASCVHGGADANAGDCHYDLTTEKDLAAVLQSTLGRISGEARGCEFQTPPGGGDSINVQVSSNGGAPMCFVQDKTDCGAGSNGWQFAKGASGALDRGRVVLCGAACDRIKQDPTAVVDVILGCALLQ